MDYDFALDGYKIKKRDRAMLSAAQRDNVNQIWRTFGTHLHFNGFRCGDENWEENQIKNCELLESRCDPDDRLMTCLCRDWVELIRGVLENPDDVDEILKMELETVQRSIEEDNPCECTTTTLDRLLDILTRCRRRDQTLLLARTLAADL
jgi:hypothetical protein